MNAEEKRLKDSRKWKNWGSYLSESAFGTVREDYSETGAAWDYFPHNHARSRAYRWNEDGIAGICDENQTICFSVAFWKGKDAILKERIFGLTGSAGNHGRFALWSGVAFYLFVFIGLGAILQPFATIETLLIRAFGTCAFIGKQRKD
ncbi:MAG TPA: hypothetical protein PKY59_00135 [Pyrinomonadaceae bacterium]|nr:hypothetical protein [Pyrinomonadaceae bacterium]